MAKSDWGSLKTRKTGRGLTWILAYLNPRTGKRTTKTLGLCRELTEAQAKAVKRAYRKRIEQRGVKPDASVRVFLDDYEDTYRSQAPRMAESQWAQYELVADYFGAKAMRDITLRDADKLVAKLNLRGWTRPLHPNTVNAYVSRLGSLWTAAKKYGIVDDNPWLNVHKPRKSEKAVPACTTEEIDRLLACLTGQLREFVSVLAETGLRKGEALRLVREDVKGGILTVRKSKNGHPRSFKITARAQLAIDAITLERGIGRSTRLFEGFAEDGGDTSHKLVSLKSACSKAGIPEINFHGVRHSFGYRMARAGAVESEIAAVLGHRDLSVTRRYMAHHPKAQAASAADKLDAADGQSNSSANDSGSKPGVSQTA